jgi:LysM repeat protein
MSSELCRRAFVRLVVLLGCGAALSWMTAASPSTEKGTTHVVQKGDTVWAIAKKYGVKPEEIVDANQLDQPNAIFPGKVLVIPRASSSSQATTPAGDGGGKHIVQKGESIWAIARMHGVSLEAIINANGLKKPYLIHPGQQLLIPGSLGPQARRQEIASLCRLPRGVRPRKWRYIIIHHSGTSVGNAAIFDRSHRRRRMENGLAYHFVIGNGKGAADGEIEVGGRWTRQLQGGHVRSRRMNEVAIGICLVGNFDKTHPTKKQMDSLTLLVKYLIGKCSVPKKRVVGHGGVQRTDCPGKNFSVSRFKKRL